MDTSPYRHNMLTRCKLIMVLLVIQASLSDAVNYPCEIPSVEEGDDATFTIRFGEDVSNDTRDFYLNFQPRVKRPGIYDPLMLKCAFKFGNVSCRNTGCCTWEGQVKDVFRVYIHNVSQEYEGSFWGYVMPAMTITVPCNFTLKVSTLQQATSGLPTPYFFTSSIPNDQTKDFSTTVSTVHQDNSRLSTQDFFASSNSNDPKKDFSTIVSNLHQAISSLSTPDFFTSSNSIDQTTDFSTTEKRNGTSIIKVLGSVIALLVTVALVSFNY